MKHVAWEAVWIFVAFPLRTRIYSVLPVFLKFYLSRENLFTHRWPRIPMVSLPNNHNGHLWPALATIELVGIDKGPQYFQYTFPVHLPLGIHIEPTNKSILCTWLLLLLYINVSYIATENVEILKLTNMYLPKHEWYKLAVATVYYQTDELICVPVVNLGYIYRKMATANPFESLVNRRDLIWDIGTYKFLTRRGSSAIGWMEVDLWHRCVQRPTARPTARLIFQIKNARDLGRFYAPFLLSLPRRHPPI